MGRMLCLICISIGVLSGTPLGTERRLIINEGTTPPEDTPTLVVLGSSRHGKSLLAGMMGGHVGAFPLGHTGAPQTREPVVMRLSITDGSGRPVVIMDTPGLNDPRNADVRQENASAAAAAGSRTAASTVEGDDADDLHMKNIQAQLLEVQRTYGGVSNFYIVLKGNNHIVAHNQMDVMEVIGNMVKGNNAGDQGRHITEFLEHVTFVVTHWERDDARGRDERKRESEEISLRQQLKSVLGLVKVGARREQTAPSSGVWRDVRGPGSGTGYVLDESLMERIRFQFMDIPSILGFDPETDEPVSCSLAAERIYNDMLVAMNADLVAAANAAGKYSCSHMEVVRGGARRTELHIETRFVEVPDGGGGGGGGGGGRAATPPPPELRNIYRHRPHDYIPPAGDYDDGVYISSDEEIDTEAMDAARRFRDQYIAYHERRRQNEGR